MPHPFHKSFRSFANDYNKQSRTRRYKNTNGGIGAASFCLGTGLSPVAYAAHSTPALWCKISIQIPPLVVPPTGSARNVTQAKIASRQATLIALQAHKMQQWVRRSGVPSLSFRTYQPLLTPPDSIRYVPYSDWDAPPVFHGQIETLTALASLRSLHLSQCTTSSFEGPVPGASSLDVWRRLATLSVKEEISPSHVATILEQCPALVHLGLSICEDIRSRARKKKRNWDKPSLICGFPDGKDNPHLPRAMLHQYVDNGYNPFSETDSAFQNFTLLPEWWKLPSFAAPVLWKVDGVKLVELDAALEDQLCPRQQHLELCSLYSLRERSLLQFIACRLRLYEYARDYTVRGKVDN
ncbi:hypothetical protein BJ165DRAFT_1590467 [Panaeolus papilionaceus]|nr:hypothetical protein BJ165DRAFT_1590467 [Panaeolus papilionaceus]